MTYWYPLASSTIGDAEIRVVNDVLRSGNTTMGTRVKEFEQAFARYVGSEHAVMVNSGSSADLLIAFALYPGGEVLIPSVTWPTHLWAWMMAGAAVRLMDVSGLNVSAQDIEAARTPNTKAISLVHLMGVPCDMDSILEACDGLEITEDCCESLGATYGDKHVGSFGCAASWSFFFSHHMTTMEGGMVTTNDASLADQLRTLRSHGWARHLPGRGAYEFVDWGFNVRPTEVQAAIGLVQLARLDEMNAIRADNYHAFTEVVKDNRHILLPSVPPKAKANWFGIPMLCNKPGLAKHLERCGVETRPILAGNLARQPVAAAMGLHGSHPGADLIHDQGLYVGLHPSYDFDAEKVAHIVNDYCR